MGYSPYEVKNVESGQEVIDDSYSPGAKLVVSTQADREALFLRLIATTTDTVPNVLELWESEVEYEQPVKLQSWTIPASAGNGTVPTVDLLAALKPYPLLNLLLTRGWVYYLKLDAAPSTACALMISYAVGIF